MKFLLKVLAILLVLLFSLKLIIHIFDKGHEVSYTIQNFRVKETLKVKNKNNYYFEIKHEKFKLNFQIFKDYNKSENVINKIMYHQFNDYECILPIFKNNDVLTDIMCLKDNEITYYRDLNSSDSEMDKFINSLEKYGYNKTNYIDSSTPKNTNNQIIYEENLLENHYLGMENYKGITLINSEVKNIKLFDNDIYTKPISIFTDKYYVVADYNSEYTFKKFYVVNLINGNIREIRSYNEISLDSVMQGAVGEDVYLFDKDAQIQYKVSLKNEMVKQVGNKDSIKYYNGKWTTMSLKEALENKTFENYHTDKIQNYVKVDKDGSYYYMYQKQNNTYSVYRADVQNPKIKTYLFKTTDLNSVIYLEKYIYYKNGKTFYYYSEVGNKKVVENPELEFNSDISLGVYQKQ